MPVYKYVASDIDGRVYTGEVEAPTEADARRALRNRRLYATELREESRSLFRALIRILKPTA